MSPPFHPPPEEIARIGTLIDAFLHERLQAKLDKLKGDSADERQRLLESYRLATWVADAARRVRRLKQITHAIKYIHPDARGSSLSSHGNPTAGERLVGTHTLNGNGVPDVVGDAAALDVYKFLRLELDGKTLLTRAIETDPAFAAALTEDPAQAHAWMSAFAELAAPASATPSSHALAKQLYWPLDNGDYHLLAPLFPTSLVHRVWTTIREDRFSETAQAAREARRNKQAHPLGYCEYPDFAVQKFGGTKPQNISQLNSERYGEACLLASVPPIWHSDSVRPPLNVETVFERWFDRRPRVRELTAILRKFLVRVQDVNNIDIRDKRSELVARIRDELLQFAAELHDLAPGWSSHKDCRLNADERYWLDPWRALEDPEFASARQAADWREGISSRFGNWLNARLGTDKTPMGDPEHREWKTVLDKELRMLREELDLDE